MAIPLARSSHRPAWRFFAIILTLGMLIIISAYALWQREPAALGWITFGYAGYELGLSVLLVVASWRGVEVMRRSKRGGAFATGGDGVTLGPDLGPRLPLSVLIAAHNERLCIGDTLESVFAQTGVELSEVIVASDGSTDGMVAMLADRYERSAFPLLVLDLAKMGKAAAMNAGLTKARGEIVVTLDADTRLGEGALAALVRTFQEDPRVVSAGGFVYVRNARPGTGGTWITRYQFWEYVKNFLWRIGLTHLGVCLQVSGAFGAFRTRVLRDELGGFDAESLVEDYEVIYRLHERFRRAGRDYRVAVAPDAAAFTEGPETVGAFVAQRTRWFAGFLQTLWDYRRMVGDGRLGAVGYFMLPVKCVDAILPLWGFLSLCILGAAAVAGGASVWQRAALGVFAGKWAVDAGLGLMLWRWHARLFPGRGSVLLPRSGMLWCILTESILFNPFRQVAVLNAYSSFLRRTRRWHQARWDVGASGGSPIPGSKLLAASGYPDEPPTKAV